jgi:lactate dehydrogenase-like 2-hydroxyacid dehydrogenase
LQILNGTSLAYSLGVRLKWKWLALVRDRGGRSMSKPILVATTYFVDAVETRLERDFELRRKERGAHFAPDELLSAADGADAMLVTPADRLDAAFFNRMASSLKVIATHSVGYDHIDLKAAAAREIAIAYLPGISTDAVADITLLLLLGASRRAFEALQLVRSGSWNPTDLTALLGWQLTGKALGICGMAQIGQAVAKRARGFDMKIHYHEPHRLSAELEGDAIFHDDPYDLLKVSAFLSLNAPETVQTHHFLDAKTIACLPHGAIVVNAARGGIVVDDDLIAALKSGQVAAVGLDTYEGEPKLHPGYLPLKNTLLLPHMGAATIETRTAMGMRALDNIEAVLRELPPPSLLTSESFGKSHFA